MCSQARPACHHSGIFQELWTHEGCILWDARVVVPLAGCKQLLQELHALHQNMANSKVLFWLLKFDADIGVVAGAWG